MESSGRKTIINLSYGICSSVTTAINEFTSAGGLFALASGNDGEDQCTELEYSTLDKSGMFLVGATEIDDDVSYFSNHGSCVDIYAPGSDILSGDYTDLNSCVSWYGTSMATPHVAGAMALLWSRHPSMTNTQLRTLLMNNALTDKLDFGSLYGNNKLLYLDNDVSGSTDSNDENEIEEFFDKYFWLIVIFVMVVILCLLGICLTLVCRLLCCPVRVVRTAAVIQNQPQQPGDYIV